MSLRNAKDNNFAETKDKEGLGNLFKTSKSWHSF